MKKRYLVPHIRRDLNEKMVLIGGARQVGMTSLSKYIAENYFKHSNAHTGDILTIDIKNTLILGNKRLISTIG